MSADEPAVTALLGVVLPRRPRACCSGVRCAVYSKAFTDVARVTLETDTAGNQLQPGADVKVRGVIVGEVRDDQRRRRRRDARPGDRPRTSDRSRPTSRARLLPKTLFGERFVSLVPPSRRRAAHRGRRRDHRPGPHRGRHRAPAGDGRPAAAAAERSTRPSSTPRSPRSPPPSRGAATGSATTSRARRLPAPAQPAPAVPHRGFDPLRRCRRDLRRRGPRPDGSCATPHHHSRTLVENGTGSRPRFTTTATCRGDRGRLPRRERRPAHHPGPGLPPHARPLRPLLARVPLPPRPW